MVTVRGGGETYQISSGKQMPWEDVPGWFKESLDMQREEPACVAIKTQAQRCMNERSFWDAECTTLTEQYHLCAANELRRELPQVTQPNATAAALPR
jgi:hypothetical protein